MDPRYDVAPIFNYRKNEYSMERMKDYIDQMFRSVEIVDGWSFISSDWGNPPKKKKEEIKKHLLKLLVVTIGGPRDKEFKYKIQIPELVQDQFFYIGGNYKIPMFQIYDYPVKSCQNASEGLYD